MVMAFATRYSYQNVNFLDFHVQPGVGDPDEFDQGTRRDAFGDLFRYNRPMTAYDPVSGETRELYPARRLMLTHLERWMRDFRIDGVRMESVVNFASWDFIRDFKDHGRKVWGERAGAQGLSGDDAEARFLVVGEELAVPIGLVSEKRLDALWNEHFKRLVRNAILGETAAGESSFESTIRKLIDCRGVGFTDGAQAVNYVTSHDVEGFRNERLYNFLNNNGVVETERRIKLAFAWLLTAVGVPMIFAGEEFADQHDLSVGHPYKQVDPVNFTRASEPWRRRVFEHVRRLVRLRTSSPALAVNDTAFIHAEDVAADRRVLVWRRGRPGVDDPVVVVANFSEFTSTASFGGEAEYRVPGWPAAPAGRSWREVTQDRGVPSEWIGREPLFPWEAKVYALT
jgi:pullulanase